MRDHVNVTLVQLQGRLASDFLNGLKMFGTSERDPIATITA